MIRSSTFQKQVLNWFESHGRRDLPWQKNPTPYRVWLSEIMLQQTQVATVIPYFLKFTKQFPTLSSLGKADLEIVLKLWAGLGYYARARNLHKTAQIIVTEYQGHFPKTFEQIIALPGIGRSTAGAILSLAFKQAHPILDGNVKRVLCRFFAIQGSPTEKNTQETLWTLSTKLTPQTQTAAYTQAMMDLGATICIRKQPHCKICPLKKHCHAYQADAVSNYPVPKKSIQKPIKKTFVAIFKFKEQILLEKRPTQGIWGGLWSFLEFETKTALQQWAKSHFKAHFKINNLLPTFRHTFTHFHLDLTGILIHLPSKTLSQKPVQKISWFTLKNPEKLPGIPAPTKKLIQKVYA